MNLRRSLIAALLLAPTTLVIAQTGPKPGWSDTAPHHREFVSVEAGVRLEVLDFGGTGRPLILLSGLGNTAHIWDNLAPKLTGDHHVVAITRRGYGRSDHPTTGYTPAILAGDIVAVMLELKIDKPVLVGHSLGGEELSYIGTHDPERVAGLIYLEAAYTYAFNDVPGDYDASLKDLRQKIDALAVSPNDLSLMRQVETSLPQFQENLQRKSAMLAHPLAPAYGPPTAADKSSFAAMRKRQVLAMGGIPPEAEVYESFSANPDGSVGAPTASPEAGRAVSSSYDHFTTPIMVPMLIITGYPQNKGAQFKADTPEKIAAATAADAAQLRHLDALRKSQPNAHVVCIPNATHYIFISNEQEVIDEIRNFPPS